MRVNALVPVDLYDAFRAGTLGYGVDDRHLRIGGVKAFVDGAIGGRTCLLDHPFEGTADDYGMQTTPTKELHEIARMVHADGNRWIKGSSRILLSRGDSWGGSCPIAGSIARIFGLHLTDIASKSVAMRRASRAP